MDKPEVDERRKTQRAPVTISVRVEDSRGVAWTGTADLSVTGMSIRSGIPRVMGERLNLLIELPGQPAVSCVGQVMSVDRGDTVGLGVRFAEISDPDRARVEAFLRDNKLFSL